jgi:carbonic anhydrase
VPSGAVLSLPMAAVLNFLSKAIDRIVERVVESKQVRDIVLVGHEDCGAYKSERVPLLAAAMKRWTGRSVADVQRGHLADAGRRISGAVRGVRVRAFYAAVVEEAGQRRVRFDEIPLR